MIPRERKVCPPQGIGLPLGFIGVLEDVEGVVGVEMGGSVGSWRFFRFDPNNVDIGTQVTRKKGCLFRVCGVVWGVGRNNCRTVVHCVAVPMKNIPKI